MQPSSSTSSTVSSTRKSSEPVPYAPVPLAIPSSSSGSSSASPSTSRKAVETSGTVSASSSRTRTQSSDPYYGHKGTSLLCACYIASLFKCRNIATVTATGEPIPTVAHFVAYALHRTRLSSTVTIAAVLLLRRLKTGFPAAQGTSGSRLFVSSFMIASKVICDDAYSNLSWSIVAQKMFTLKEINHMERELCACLQCNLNI